MQWLFHHYLTGSAAGSVSLHINFLLLKSTTAAQCKQFDQTRLAGMCNNHVTLWKKLVVLAMDANASVLSDRVTPSGFAFARAVGDARLLLRPAQGHYSRGDVCEQRTHNPGCGTRKTTRPPGCEQHSSFVQKHSLICTMNLRSQ